jgi:acetyltransferase-like isoleucine patch superfamily enzyme
MFERIVDFYKRIKFIQHSHIRTGASLVLGADLKIDFSPMSEVIVNGKVSISLPHPNSPDLPCYKHSMIKLGRNSKLIFDGDVFIAGGFYLSVADNATVIFRGKNFIGRNSTIISKHFVELGFQTSVSWNFVGMDFDGHQFFNINKEMIKKVINPLIIGKNVAIQANVFIPKGLIVGHDSIIGSNTTLRCNTDPNQMIFTKNDYVIRKDMNFGFQ